MFNSLRRQAVTNHGNVDVAYYGEWFDCLNRRLEFTRNLNPLNSFWKTWLANPICHWKRAPIF